MIRHPAFDIAEEGAEMSALPVAQGIYRARETDLANRAHNDLRAVLSTPEGRRFVWGLLEHCGVFGPSYASDPNATSYNEGRRAVGIGLMVRCQTEASEFYVEALKEHLCEVSADAATKAAAMAAASAAEPQEIE